MIRRGGGRRLVGCRGGALAVALAAALTMAVASGPAGASGDRGLSREIIPNPLPSWVPEPAHTLNTVVSFLNGLEDDAVLPSNTNVRTAAGGWHNPANPSQYLVIALVALRFNGASPSSAAAQTKQAAVSALASLCAGGAAQSTVHVGTIAVIPSSHTLTCTLAKNGAQPFASAWSRGNVMALVLSTQPSVSTDQMILIAATEYEHMPPNGFVVPAPPAASSSTGVIVGVVAGVVVLFVVGVVVGRRRRSTARRGRGTASRGGPRPRPAAAPSAPPAEPVSSTASPRAEPPPPRRQARQNRSRKQSSKPPPQVRRGVVQRPASLAGGIGPPSAASRATPTEETPPHQP